MHKPNRSNEINWPKIALAKYLPNVIFGLWEFSQSQKSHKVRTSEGIKYSNREYTRVGYPILGYFRVQVPENLREKGRSNFRMVRKISSKLIT